MGLLSLHDQALAFILTSLGSASISDEDGGRDEALADSAVAARNLGRCCSRLNSIYRETVTTLSLSKSYTAVQCARLTSRHPNITALTINLSSVPNFSLLDVPFTTPKAWSAPAEFPSCLISSTLKSVSFENGSMHVRELQAIFEKASGLEAVSLSNVNIYLERNASEYPDEACSVALERSAPSLKRFTFCGSSIGLHKMQCAVDLRWLALSRLTSVTHLVFGMLLPMPHGDAFHQVANMRCLQSLTLFHMHLRDEDIEVVFPSLTHLRSVCLSFCRALTYRVLACLPRDLDLLDVSHTSILSVAGGRPGTKVGTGKLAVLVAADVPDPCFEYLMEFFGGSGFRRLDLKQVAVKSAAGLSFLLERAKGLRWLNLSGAHGLMENDLVRISNISGLTSRGNGLFTK